MEIRRATILGFTLFMAGLSLCGVGLWLLLSPAQYRATVRIAVNEDASDNGFRNYMIKIHPDAVEYDPYFIEYVFEDIRSQPVLSNVVESLNFSVEWGKKHGIGSPLKTAKTIELLKRRMGLTAVRNTELIGISFRSEDPSEAAGVANAIAKAYQDYRLQERKQETKGIEALQQEYQEEEKKIQILQTNVDLLREKYKINKDDEASFGLVPGTSGLMPNEVVKQQKESERTKPFWDEKRKLENLLEFHKLLAAKIASEKLDLSIPKFQSVTIIDLARPPKSPASPNRFLGAVLLAIGLFPTVGGFLMIKSSRHRPCSAS